MSTNAPYTTSDAAPAKASWPGENTGPGRAAVKVGSTRLSVATVVVGKWTGDLDEKRLKAQLNNESGADADEPEQALDVVTAHLPAQGKA